MRTPRVDIFICRTPLSAPAPVFSDSAGAVLDFWGVVRGLEGETAIAGIDYEAHEAMALHQLQLLAQEAGSRHPIIGLEIYHRIGFVPAAEPSLFLRVMAAHRGPAFDAGRWLIEQLKLRVPIWKHPLVGIPHPASPGEAAPDNSSDAALATARKAEH